MSNHDQLYRYLFNNCTVRGGLVSIKETFQRIVASQNYPAEVRNLLGELLVATSLLTATLEFDGDITLQIQGNGPLKLAVVNGNNKQELRGVAHLQDGITEDSSLKNIIDNGYIVITVSPTVGEHYQNILDLKGKTLAECLENYLMQSTKLPTRIFIRTGEVGGQPAAGGMLLQALPTADADPEELNHLAHLTATIKAEELLNLSAKEVLYRLYHQEEVTLYEPQGVCFHCTCSLESCASSLLTLPDKDILEMLEADGKIEMRCDYCGADYEFNTTNLAKLKSGGKTHSGDSRAY